MFVLTGGSSGSSGSGSGVTKVANAAALAALIPVDGDFAVQLDTDELYYYNVSLWQLFADGKQVTVHVKSGTTLALINTATPIHVCTGNTPNYILQLPDATTLPKMKAYTFLNMQGSLITIQDPTAGFIVEVQAYDSKTVYLFNNAVAAGSWYGRDQNLMANGITNTPAGNLAAITVQTALNELQGDIDTINGAAHSAVTLGAVGAAPNANGASLAAQVLTLQPADATNPGVIANATQAIPGEKRFAGGVQVGTSTALGVSEIFVAVSTTKGTIPAPVMTSTQRDSIGTPTTGMHIYNSTLKQVQVYDGTLWQNTISPNVPVALTPTDASTPTILGHRRQIQKVSGSGGVAVSLTDLSVSGNLDGDELTIMCTSDTATVTIVSATNTVINGSCTLANGDMINLILISAKWYEKSRSM